VPVYSPVFPGVDPAQNYASHDRGLSLDIATGSFNEKCVDEINEDGEGLVGVPESLGVTVHRPIPLPYNAAKMIGLEWERFPSLRST
jgi:hypothetical protein